MNRLPLEKRSQIIQLHVEGNSVRACSRIADVSVNTVLKLINDVGSACMKFHSQTVVRIRAKRIQCDELWSFVYAKKKTVTVKEIESGDAWTWMAMDQDTKLIITFYVGSRLQHSANMLMNDLYQRLLPQYNTATQITTDGYTAYQEAVADSFGGKINFAQLVKKYDAKKHYIGADKKVICGKPNKKYITTSHIERQNLTIRMGVRRYARKTNAFSKKMHNHICGLAIHCVYYNFGRIHKTLRVTPAMEAKIAKRPMTFDEIAQLPDVYLKRDKLNSIKLIR
jgi:IS1 family transposase